MDVLERVYQRPMKGLEQSRARSPVCSGKEPGWTYQQSSELHSLWEGDVPLSVRDKPVNNTLGKIRVLWPVHHPKGIRECSFQKRRKSTAQLKSLHQHTGDKQKEQKSVVQSEICGAIAVTETRCRAADLEHCSWGLPAFQRDWLGTRGGCAVLCVKEWMDCENLPLSDSRQQLGSCGWKSRTDRQLFQVSAPGQGGSHIRFCWQ